MVYKKQLNEAQKIILYFVIYSFLGWILETIFAIFVLGRFVKRGFLYGPVCPIYGFGACIMFLFLENLSNNVILLFIVSFVILTLWEYIVGVLLEKIFHTKYWDYSNYKINIQQIPYTGVH